MLVSPTLASAYQQGWATVGWAWWLTNTPVHLVWEGSEAVVVFFVLSGFVLTLPFLGPTARPTWRFYYAQRLIRLYVPVAASLVLAAATYLAFNHSALPGMSWWMASHNIRPSIGLMTHDLPLVFETSKLNSVLWSLRWELLFSLLLPLVLFPVVRSGPITRLSLAAMMIAMVAVTALAGLYSARYLPMFGLGVVMAAERVRLKTWAARIGPAGWVTVVVGALALLFADWIPVIEQSSACHALTTLGAALLIAAALWCPPMRAGLSHRHLQWLGRRSYSLYLVHEPIVVSSALLIRTTSPTLMIAVAVPASLIVTAVFYRLVEHPSQWVAKRAGRLVEATIPPVRLPAATRGARSSEPRESAAAPRGGR